MLNYEPLQNEKLTFVAAPRLSPDQKGKGQKKQHEPGDHQGDDSRELRPGVLGSVWRDGMQVRHQWDSDRQLNQKQILLARHKLLAYLLLTTEGDGTETIHALLLKL